MLTNIKYILLTALRDWLFSGLAVMVIACAMIANFLGSTALVENAEMSITYSSAVVRVILIFGLILFSCFHIHNAFDTKEIDVFLSRPLTRGSLILSYWLGFCLLAVLLVIPAITMVILQGVLSWQGLAFWSIGLMLECWLIVAITVFASFSMRSLVVPVLGTMCFYIIARLTGFFIAIMQPSHHFAATLLGNALPRLDFFTRSAWLVYGLNNTQDTQIMLFFHAACFIPLFILATIFCFRRKEF